MNYDEWCIFQTHIERAIGCLVIEDVDIITRLNMIVKETEPKRDSE